VPRVVSEYVVVYAVGNQALTGQDEIEMRRGEKSLQRSREDGTARRGRCGPGVTYVNGEMYSDRSRYTRVATVTLIKNKIPAVRRCLSNE